MIFVVHFVSSVPKDISFRYQTSAFEVCIPVGSSDMDEFGVRRLRSASAVTRIRFQLHVQVCWRYVTVAKKGLRPAISHSILEPERFSLKFIFLLVITVCYCSLGLQLLSLRSWPDNTNQL
jgi:hypothetical protein